MAIALVGLPVVLLGAWLIEPAAPEANATASARQPWRSAAIALVVILLLAVGGWYALQRSQRYDAIAVLPFENATGQPENEVLADGLADELINSLAGVPGLRVTARTSSFAFKGSKANIRVIADTLNVDAVIEGTVHRSSQHVRVTVRLVDARTGYQSWSRAYERSVDQVASIQQTMASEIVDALAVQLARGQREELYLGGTLDPAAYELYLRGRQKWVKRQIGPLREAIADFQAAIARDSSFALAWSGLADAIDALAFRSPVDRGLVPIGRYAAQRAILLEPGMAEGWASLGNLAVDFDNDRAVGELALRHALQLKPNYVPAVGWLGDLLRLSGRPAEALEFNRRAYELDPLAPQVANTLGLVLIALGRFNEARDIYLKNRQANAGSPIAMNMIVYGRAMSLSVEQVAVFARDWANYAGLPAPADAEAVARAILSPQLKPAALAALQRISAHNVNRRDLARLSAAIGDYDGALRYLEQSVEGGEAVYAYGVDPSFDPMREDPRFIAFLQRLKIPNCDFACRTAPGAR